MDQKTLATILIEAETKGYLMPSKEEDKCLSDYLNTANYILYHLKREPLGLSTSQIVNRLGFSLNTVKCYLRELVNLKLVKRERQANQEAVWSYRQADLQETSSKMILTQHH